MAVGDKLYLGGGEVYPRGETSFFSIDESVTTTEITKTLPQASRTIKYISNDGDTDLYIAFNSTSTSATAGKDGRIRLAAGETLNELNISATTIKLKRPSGTGIVRAVIV